MYIIFATEFQFRYIISETDPQQYKQMRKLLSIVFLAKTLMKQKRIIMKIIDNFMIRISKDSKPEMGGLNMTKWYNIWIFDILKEIAFDRSFHCIKTSALRNSSFFLLNFLFFDFLIFS